MSDLIEYSDVPQGSEQWKELRRGAITASRAKAAMDRKKDGSPGSVMLSTAYDIARERVGGKPYETYQTAAMRMGSEEEDFGAIAYMAKTGRVVETCGLVKTSDGKFGASLDRRVVGENAALEIKTMVSSTTLFKAMVDGDISEYRDQCVFEMWLLRLDWVDLCLWAPDLGALRVIRIERDEDEIERLEEALIAFDRLIGQFESALRKVIADATETTESAPWDDKPAAAELPDDIFA